MEKPSPANQSPLQAYNDWLAHQPEAVVQELSAKRDIYFSSERLPYAARHTEKLKLSVLEQDAAIWNAESVNGGRTDNASLHYQVVETVRHADTKAFVAERYLESRGLHVLIAKEFQSQPSRFMEGHTHVQPTKRHEHEPHHPSHGPASERTR